MNFEEIRKILKTSNPKDWLYDRDNEICTYKPDVGLNILTEYPNDPNDPDSRKELDEDWVKEFPNNQAWMVIAKVIYSGSFVKQYLFASVDGGRNIIALPKSTTELEITHLQYNMGKVLDYQNIDARLREYDFKIKTAGIKVKKAIIY